MLKSAVILLILVVASSDAWFFWRRRTTPRPPTTGTTTTTTPLPISPDKSYCTHSKSSNSVTCTSPSGTSETCATVAPARSGWFWFRRRAPNGTYLIENAGWRDDKNTYWYNLHPRRQDGLYHDYYDWNPDTWRRKISLHGGSHTSGSITVSQADNECFTRLRNVINAGTNSTETVHRRWFWRFGSSTTRNITYIGTMVVS